MKKFFISMLLLICFGSIAQAQFTVYRELFFSGQPAGSYFDGLGLKASHGVYQDAVTGGTIPVKQSLMISTAQSTAANYALYQNRMWYDIEYLDTDAGRVGTTQASANALQLAKFIGWAKAAAPTLGIGLYSQVPVTDLWTSSHLAQRQAWNNLLQPLADALDFLCPSIYLYFNESTVSYASYAGPMIQEAKRLAKGKKVYAFVAPGYHPSGDYPNRYASYSVWMNVLNSIKNAGADGVFIFAGKGAMGSQPYNWSYIDTCGWWRATKEFMKTLGTSPTITSPLPPPSIISPTSGLRVTPTNFTARWRRVSGAIKYQVQLARASSFSTPVFSDSAITDTLRRFTGLTRGANYWFRVRTRGSSGWGSWSPIVAFSTSSTLKPDDDDGLDPDASTAPEVFALAQNYPNPFNPKTGIRFQVSDVSDVKLAVYDMLGREVALLVNERKGPGSYEVSFEGSGLASGVYIYRLTAGSYVQSRRMVLLK